MKSLRSTGKPVAGGGSAGLVGPPQRRRIEIGADQALGGRGFLDFGDQRVVAAIELGANGGEKAARLACGLRHRLDLDQRMRALGVCDLVALVGFDLLQDIGHAAP
jgi:hypothetical protein